MASVTMNSDKAALEARVVGVFESLKMVMRVVHGFERAGTRNAAAVACLDATDGLAEAIRNLHGCKSVDSVAAAVETGLDEYVLLVFNRVSSCSEDKLVDRRVFGDCCMDDAVSIYDGISSRLGKPRLIDHQTPGDDGFSDISLTAAVSAVFPSTECVAHIERIGYAKRGVKPGCFALMCSLAGLDQLVAARSVSELRHEQMVKLARIKDFKVWATVHGLDDPRNHVELVDGNAVNAFTRVSRVLAKDGDSVAVVVTSMQQFFSLGSEYFTVKFYSEDGHETFGGHASGMRGAVPVGSGTAAAAAAATAPAAGPQSVSGADVVSGMSNVTGGVVRSKRRNISSKSAGALSGPVAKNYRTVGGIMFNNADELFQDKISREYAQEIVEELMSAWGVPVEQPRATKYAEDLIFSFLVAVTASNKADYNRTYYIPVDLVERHGEQVNEIQADFSVLSKLLESGHGKTRRQFARALSDDLRDYLKHEENTHILPQLATRVGCEPQLAYLAFDGSTHCSGMTTREVAFTRNLEMRNLFERDDVVAQGASERLMGGLSGGVRSVVPR